MGELKYAFMITKRKHWCVVPKWARKDEQWQFFWLCFYAHCRLVVG